MLNQELLVCCLPKDTHMLDQKFDRVETPAIRWHTHMLDQYPAYNYNYHAR
jgi:hypothetical protein